MAFFGLFKSRSERDQEAKIRFRQGKARIQRFVQQSRQSAEHYWQLARRAHKLGDVDQLRQLAGNFFRARESINRWERFLVKMDALEMRRNEVEATADFVRSMNALTSVILRGSSPTEISKMQLDVERAIAKAEEQEELMAHAMDAAGSGILSTEELTDETLDRLMRGVDLNLTDGESPVDNSFETAMASYMPEKPPETRPAANPETAPYASSH